MQNRDYFSRPHQSGSRSAHDYGRTNIDQNKRQDFWIWLGLICSLLAVGAIGLFVS